MFFAHVGAHVVLRTRLERRSPRLFWRFHKQLCEGRGGGSLLLVDVLDRHQCSRALRCTWYFVCNGHSYMSIISFFPSSKSFHRETSPCSINSTSTQRCLCSIHSPKYSCAEPMILGTDPILPANTAIYHPCVVRGDQYIIYLEVAPRPISTRSCPVREVPEATIAWELTDRFGGRTFPVSRHACRSCPRNLELSPSSALGGLVR